MAVAVKNVFLCSASQLLVTANVVPSSQILVDDEGVTYLRNVGSYKSHTA
jgi:hypothetical protein